MIVELPHCIHRGKEVEPDMFVCNTDRLIHKGVVSGQVCRERCPYVNLPRLEPAGLGDMVHVVTHAMGVDRIVAAIGDCGCAGRKDWLNSVVPFRRRKDEVPDLADCPPLLPGRLSYPGEVRRNLMMYLYPIAEFQVWRWNVEQILKRMHLFNGKRAVTIMTDNRTDSAAAVQEAFCGERIDAWIIGENNQNTWEMQGLPHMMDIAYSCDPNEITFYCHGKGSQGPEHIDGHTFSQQPRVKWATVMYTACLDDMAHVEKQLETHTFAGAFKRRMVYGSGPYRSSWHFAGTFYWFRNARLFALPSWRNFELTWCGAETYPGQHVGWGQSAGLFYDHPPGLYPADAWVQDVDIRWEQWKQEKGICTPA